MDQHKFKTALLDMGVEPDIASSLSWLPESRLADIHQAIVQVRSLEAQRVLEIVKEDITKFQGDLRVANTNRKSAI